MAVKFIDAVFNPTDVGVSMGMLQSMLNSKALFHLSVYNMNVSTWYVLEGGIWDGWKDYFQQTRGITFFPQEE